MAELPLFPVTVVGSWPRPRWLLQALKKKSADLPALMDEATLLAVKYQEDAGVDLISDGEQRRDNFVSFVAERFEGMQLMTMAELLDHVEDKAAFEAILTTLDVPAFAIRNPTVVGKLAPSRPLALDDFRFLREHTRLPIKVALPGPYILSRSTWVKSLSAAAYPTRESLADDLVRYLREEVRALADAGCEMIQFDEPVLTELVFAGKSATHTFMCGALAASADPAAELEFAVSLLNRVIEGVDGPTFGLHICRGNWSQEEDVLLTGSYDNLIPHLQRIHVQQFVLEYATPRAGAIEVLADLPRDAQIGFGVVNPRTTEVEQPEWIADRVRKLARIRGGPEGIYLNPDCGFGTFAERPVATAEVAYRKLRALSGAAEILRRS